MTKTQSLCTQLHIIKTLCMNVYGVCVLPNSMFFQQPLDRDRQLPQEAFDDWPTLCKLILHLDLQDISGQRHKVKPLEIQTNRGKSIVRTTPVRVIRVG